MSKTATIQVLFFGATAEIVGKRRIELSLPDGSPSNMAFDLIRAEFPRLSGHKLHYSVNQVYAAGDEAIRNGDELAIFTAVSGG